MLCDGSLNDCAPFFFSFFFFLKTFLRLLIFSWNDIRFSCEGNLDHSRGSANRAQSYIGSWDDDDEGTFTLPSTYI